MAQIPNNKVKAACVLNERVASLLDDGYRVMFRASGFYSDMWYVSLRHKNGHKVTITAYWKANKIVQKTDGRVTHEGSLY